MYRPVASVPSARVRALCVSIARLRRRAVLLHSSMWTQPHNRARFGQLQNARPHFRRAVDGARINELRGHGDLRAGEPGHRVWQ